MKKKNYFTSSLNKNTAQDRTQYCRCPEQFDSQDSVFCAVLTITQRYDCLAGWEGHGCARAWFVLYLQNALPCS